MTLIVSEATETTPWRGRSDWARKYFALWGGQAVSILGSHLVQFALIWWLTQTTGSATVLATAALAGMLPQIVLGPLVGTFVDRWNRRLTMIVADSAIALATLLLAYLFWIDHTQLGHVYAILFIRSLGGAFHWSAMSASTSLMVPEAHLSRVQGFNQMLNGGLNIIAAPLGALLLQFLPIQGILAIDVGTALIAIAPLLFIQVPQPESNNGSDPAASPKATFWHDLGAGLRYVTSWPGMMILMALAVLINLLLSPAFALLPILVTQHFGGNALQLGWLESAAGLGIVLGGLLLGVWGGFKRRVVTSLVGLIGLGIGTTLVGLTPATMFALSVGAMFLVGGMSSITNGPILAVIQSTVEPEMQGRVFTLLNSVASMMAPLGLVIAGPLSDAFGVRTWFLLGGAVTTLLGLTGFLLPALLNLETRAQKAPALGTTPESMNALRTTPPAD